MEVMLQWLDDLEDLIFAVPLVWERLRRRLLNVGLVAAVGLHADSIWHMAAWWVPLCAVIAALVAAGWFMALVASRAGNLRARIQHG